MFLCHRSEDMHSKNDRTREWIGINTDLNEEFFINFVYQLFLLPVLILFPYFFWPTSISAYLQVQKKENQNAQSL